MKKKKNSVLTILSRPIAHRGLHDDVIPENSLPAFDKAAEKGYDIELDIMASKDGEIVVFHDYDLKRMCGIDRKIKDCDYAELRKCRLLDTEEHIPLFKEVLDTVKGRSSILVEFKIGHDYDKEIIGKTLELLSAYPYKNRIALQSFNPYAVRDLKKNGKGYCVGQLSTGNLENENRLNKFLFKTLLVTLISKPDFITYDIDYLSLPHPRFRRCLGYPVISWTIDSEAKLKKARKYSDNFIFERVDPAK